jgi:muramidase (phage lysozyme)
MGLDPKTTRFTPEVQDAMFNNYLQDRVGRADTMEGKRRQLRNAWEGFKRVPDQRLDAAIRQLST